MLAQAESTLEAPSRQAIRLAPWLPAGAAVAVTVAVLVAYGVSASDIAAFSLYVAIGLTVPGMLLWRAAHGCSRSWPEDLAAGTVVGYAFEVLVYIPARTAGIPLLALGFPIATIVVFLAVPSLRRFLRGGGPGAAPPLWWSWSLAAIFVLLVGWSAVAFFEGHGLTWPGNASPYIDMPFHLALAGEIKHHMPPDAPQVLGEPLRYHWFVYTDLAATSWATGVDLQTLLYRLAGLPTLGCIAIIVAITAVRLTRAWWTGVAAAVVLFLSFAANPYRWTISAVFEAQNLFSVWLSPTHVFGLALFGLVVLLVIDVISAEHELGGSPRPDWLAWVLLAVAVAALSGSKATFLPMLVAGLGLVVVCDALRRRRPTAATLLALAIAVGGLIFAQFVLFGGSTGSGGFDPLAMVKRFPISTATGLNRIGGSTALGILVVLTSFALVAWAFIWSGASGLIVGRRHRERPIQFLIGVGLSGIAATLLLSFPGLAQGYFFRGVAPTLAILAAVGLATFAPAGRRPALLVAASTAAIALGALTAVLLRALSPQTAPSLATHDRVRHVLQSLAWPWVTMIAVLALTALALRAATKRWPVLAGMVGLIVAFVAMGFGVPQAWRLVGDTAREAVSTQWQPTPLADGSPEIRADELAAARWLRANSDPHDVVATNNHCRPSSLPACDIRHFWISAYTERRLLVEGWGYTTRANDSAYELGVAYAQAPFWDPELLAANDAAFTSPSNEALMKLRNHGVRWLYADPRGGAWSPRLAEVARMRFQAGGVVIYEIVA